MKRATWSMMCMICAVALLIPLCTGCATSSPKTATAVGSMPPPPDPVVTLAPGDELDIKFYYAPELNERQVIRPDGMITLQLVGDMRAAGLTPEGLEVLLRREYEKLIDRNEVVVIVRRFYGRMVYVGGAVTRPRAVEMPGNLTVLAAVMQAGGFDYGTAEPEQVLVMRPFSGTYKLYEVDLSKRLAGKELVPFYLHPQDIIYVSRSRIADANKWMEQYINRMVPLVGFSAYRSVGDTVIGINTTR